MQVQFQRFRDLATNRQHRVERCHRILEDHGDPVAADVAELVLAHLQQILTVKPHLAIHDLPGGCGIRRISDITPTLLPEPESPYNCDGFALVHDVGDPIYSMDDAILCEEARSSPFTSNNFVMHCLRAAF